MTTSVAYSLLVLLEERKQPIPYKVGINNFSFFGTCAIQGLNPFLQSSATLSKKSLYHKCEQYCRYKSLDNALSFSYTNQMV